MQISCKWRSGTTFSKNENDCNGPAKIWNEKKRPTAFWQKQSPCAHSKNVSNLDRLFNVVTVENGIIAEKAVLWKNWAIIAPKRLKDIISTCACLLVKTFFYADVSIQWSTRFYILIVARACFDAVPSAGLVPSASFKKLSSDKYVIIFSSKDPFLKFYWLS